MNRWLPASLLLLCAPAWATELVITEKNGETAVVLIDEFVKGETPLETSADAGSVELAFRGSMFGPVLFTHAIEVPASGKVELVVDMGGRSVEVVSSGGGDDGGGDAASTGSVTVKAKKDGLGLTLDGKPIDDKTPATLELAPGKHIVSVESPCHSGESEFTIEAGGSQTVDIPLTTLKAMLEIKSDPSGADIFIDGKELGKAPMNAKLRCGERTLKAVKEGYEATEQKVEVGVDNAITLSMGGDSGGSSTTTAPKPVSPTPKPTKPSKPKGDGPKIAPIAVGSAAVVAAVPVGLLGAYNYQQARVAYDDYLEVTDEETREQIYNEQVRPRQTVAFAEFAGAGVLAVGGGALIVAGLVDGEVYAAPTANGFVIGGRF